MCNFLLQYVAYDSSWTRNADVTAHIVICFILSFLVTIFRACVCVCVCVCVCACVRPCVFGFNIMKSIQHNLVYSQ
jgi:uncharacterized membrane protein